MQWGHRSEMTRTRREAEKRSPPKRLQHPSGTRSTASGHLLVPLSTIFLPRNFLQASIKASTWGTLGDFLCPYKPLLTIFLNPQIPITPSTAQ